MTGYAYDLPAVDEFTVTVLEILCCLYPPVEDEAAVTTVGTGGATLLSMTLTVALEDDDIWLLLLLLDTLEKPWDASCPWFSPPEVLLLEATTNRIKTSI